MKAYDHKTIKPRCYKREKLGAAVNQSMKIIVEVWCEIVTSLGVR
jgi:hypothetical protein